MVFEKKREQEEIDKLDEKYCYNQKTQPPSFKYKQEIIINSITYENTREASRKTGIPRTTITRNIDNKVSGYQLGKKVSYAKDYSSQSTPVVVNDIVYEYCWKKWSQKSIEEKIRNDYDTL